MKIQDIFETIAAIILTMILSFALYCALDHLDKSQTYPAAATVVETSHDLVVVETSTGMEFAFYDDGGDWEVGDLVAMIMDNNTTPDDVTDDRIIDARFAG